MDRQIGYTSTSYFTVLEDLENLNHADSSNDLRLNYCGIESCEPDHSFGPYVRRSFVIHIVLEGQGHYQYENQTYHLKAGQAFLIYPDITTTYWAEPSDPWRYMWVGFSGILAESMTTRSGFTRETPVISIKDSSDLFACINHILDRPHLTYVDYLQRQGELYKFFGYLIENSLRPSITKDKHDYPQSYYVKQAVTYIKYHYMDPVKIDGLASYIGITRSYLTTCFQKEIHMSPKEYLMDVRMRKAAELLENSSLSIGEIAASVGYPDQLGFSKRFKEKFGMSPKHYRKSEIRIEEHNVKNEYTRTVPL